MAAIERLSDPLFTVGESPVWRTSESALYWVDIPAKKIHRLDPASGRIDAWTGPEQVACIAFDAEGGIIAGLETGIFALRLGNGGTVSSTRLAAPAMPMPNMRFNDGRCDRQGRFWAGTMHQDIPAAHPVGALYRYSALHGLTGPVENGLMTQNGLAWSPKGDRMYLSDSNPKAQLVWAFDYDTDTGTPSNKRLFVDMNLHPGRPDGAAVDADGCYWTCANDAGQLLRFTPEGKLDRSIALPVKKPSMCAFGGVNFDTLYVTSIRPAKEADLVDQPAAGALFALRPGIQGLPEAEFGAPKHNA
ncbi:SMP-30/gluconolactonase/LRE family protein [Usitatibacter palustris]|uniref:6-deoxy-6-sulfogluconolactonase n=1 Tax=Usitatibacter palustris TaxID=2732487 RepID=A0A6M4H8B8_9PROT|nr:SMP-30/gluconolactonase/LRE family protein [Usitatibacter palustris]QJR14624.1 6-deoxy-6-sulfogluconolactonase [Usitatibacter palustris]